jgi:Domain of unknown function (DUF4268)
MSIRLGQLTRVEPRTVWSHEATEFTPWLAECLDRLGDLLGMDLELIRREAAVGDFSADLVARDLNRDRIVIIENQLNPTDHTHLGQLITYAAGLDAGAVVWVSPQLREEHRQALDWLNRRLGSSIEFFSVVLEVIKVDNSLPAPNFRLAAFPNNWGRQVKEVGNLSGRRAAYQGFFQNLIDEMREKHRLTNARAGLPQNWYTFSTGVAGIKYGVAFSSSRLRAELYIDGPDVDANAAVFQALDAEREQIEHELGFSLSWERLDHAIACRIAVYRDDSSVIESDREMLLTWTIEKLLRLRAVFGPRLRPAVAKAQAAFSAESPAIMSTFDPGTATDGRVAPADAA